MSKDIETLTQKFIGLAVTEAVIPVNPQDAIAALRELLSAKLIGKDITPDGSDVELPETVYYVSGMKELRAKLKELNVEFEKLSSFHLQTRKIESLVYRFCKEAEIDIDHIITPEVGECLNRIGGTEVYYYGDDFMIHVQNPVKFEVSRDGNVRAHCENDAYLKFEDGSGLYALEDIIVPEWVVMNETATAEQIMGIADVDVRARAIKKFGILPLIETSTLLHEQGDYKLYDLSKVLNLDKPAPHIHMYNPSEKINHVEGVGSNCTTVDEAMAYRAGGVEWNPCKFDEFDREGGNPLQTQQGDVLMMQVDELPEGLEKLDRGFVLSPENQRRHELHGKYTLYGNDTEQYLVCEGEVALKHPTHGTQIKTGIVKLWAVVEYDYIQDMERTVID